jgi:cystathionine gamma-synthase
MENNNYNIQTKLIHAGSENNKNASNAVSGSIQLSTTFERNTAGETGAFIYSRADNPNRKELENKLAAIENAAEVIAFASGMAAINALLENILQPNSHIIIPNDCYHGTRALINSFYTKWQIQFTEVDTTNADNIKNALQANTKLIWIETPSNPQLKITDIEAASKIAKANNITLVCDNTFATCLIQNPFAHGADFVMHSSTKYIGGHSDVLSGIVVAKEKTPISDAIRLYQKTAGAVPSPFDCWLLNRSLATFAIRVKMQNENAMKIALWLEKNDAIEKVFYPGLASHTNHAIAAKQMCRGFGSIVSVLVKGNQSVALKLASSFAFIKHATSLGGVESLVEHRRSVEGDNPISPENLLRFSIGIEYADDLIADIEKGIASL